MRIRSADGNGELSVAARVVQTVRAEKVRRIGSFIAVPASKLFSARDQKQNLPPIIAVGIIPHREIRAIVGIIISERLRVGTERRFQASSRASGLRSRPIAVWAH